MDLAGIRGYNYIGEATESDWPKGCYSCEDTADCEDGVFFNNDATGAANGNATSLCAIEGWEAALDETKVLFVGDSDMDYWNTNAFLPESQNVGYGGYTCEETLAEIDANLDVFKPDWVVMTCGENDLTDSDVATTYPFFEQIVDKILATGARAITLGTKPEPDTGDLHAQYEEYDDLVRELATDTAAASSEGTPPPLVMIDTYPSFVEIGNPGTLYHEDGLHLADDGGYEYWQEWLETALVDDESCTRWVSGSCDESTLDDDDNDDGSSGNSARQISGLGALVLAAISGLLL
jgi:lysophospholipase L1-like esterase